MKIVIQCSFILMMALSAFSQSSYYLENNNIRARISDNGNFFNDQNNNIADYEYPIGSNKYAIYSMGYWMGGLDQNSSLHLGGQQYGIGSDYFPGPVSDDYNSTYYQDNFSSSIWFMTNGIINYHKDHYLDQGYVADQHILNWPGSGNTAEGVSAQLAPYIDVNQNGTYDPLNGDYPYINGEAAVYTIMNDAAGVHTETGGEQLGVEIHSMFYQFNSNDDLNNTTFLNLKIYNRTDTNYTDFVYGIWMDPDIGSAANDYIGCDTTRNLGYGYNGEATDLGQGGQNPYNAQVPAVGAVFLNKSMDKFVYHNIGGGTQGDPSSASDFYSYLNGIWLNGDTMTYGGTGIGGAIQTDYMFSGNPFMGFGWNEVSEGNPPGDRRFLMTTKIGDLPAHSEKCIDIAFVINNADSDHLSNVTNLFSTTDFVQAYYDNNILPCENIVVSINKAEALKIEVYPNPILDQFKINVGQPFFYEILDVSGALIQTGKSLSPSTELFLNAEPGLYLIKVQTETGQGIEKILVK